ncbi:Cytochrome P450 83B1 [Vitis vinifera]|uniref:Cytochrome P450 83B1 n=1 Tax=Vitis vinifera TaxID=29760 RepID=A0A438K1Q8_VITVI|nr:Cytochrome P450 83B1 [Vitis vinifera]
MVRPTPSRAGTRAPKPCASEPAKKTMGAMPWPDGASDKQLVHTMTPMHNTGVQCPVHQEGTAMGTMPWLVEAEPDEDALVGTRSQEAPCGEGGSLLGEGSLVVGGCASGSGRLHNHQGKNCRASLLNRTPTALRWQRGRKGKVVSECLGCWEGRLAKEGSLAPRTRSSSLGQQRLSYNGLDLAFAPYDGYWREMRKICVLHPFSSKRVQSFRSIREVEVSRMIEKFSKSASAAKLTDLSETVMLLTSNIICRTAFGKRYEDKGYDRSRFHGLLNDAQAMMGSFFFTDHFPSMGWVDKLTGLIAQTGEEFQGIGFDVFVAGTDPGAATLVWAMAEVTKNPGGKKKAQEELRTVFGRKGFVDEDDLHKLPYLKALVKETLRVHPPAPLLLPKETLENCTIDGYDIPPKTLVFVNAWAIGRDPEAWENPEEILPERFLSSSVDFKGQDYELISFSVGRRGCPGIHLGVVTVELALANLLYSFD